MGRTTVAVTLNPRPGRDGLHVVRLRITKDRSPAYFSLNVSLSEKSFNPAGKKHLKNWVRKSCSGFVTLNDRINDAYDRAEHAIAHYERSGAEFGSSDIRAYLEQGGLPERLIPFYMAHVAQRRADAGNDLGKIKTADGYEDTVKVLRHYLRETYRLPKTLPDSELDNRYWLLSSFTRLDIEKVKAWMDNHYAPNSTTSYLRNIRHVLYLAADAGLVSRERFPMRGIVLKIERKKVQRLQDSEIEQLAIAPAPKKHKGGHPHVTDPIHARALAMSMYLVHGARLSDALTWRVKYYIVEGEQHRLRYKTGKNDRDMSVLLDAEAIDLLAPYRLRDDGSPKGPNDFLFPYLPDNFDKLPVQDQYLTLRRARNRARKQVTQHALRTGLTKHVTPHVMRHSFADMMRRAGVPLETRQETLGHGDIKTTRMYEEQFDQQAVDAVTLLYQQRKTGNGSNSAKTNLSIPDSEQLPEEK